MAFEKYAYRYEILNFGGIEALMKVSITLTFELYRHYCISPPLHSAESEFRPQHGGAGHRSTSQPGRVRRAERGDGEKGYHQDDDG